MITKERLNNGLVVLVEEIPHLQSAAYSLLIPGGMVADCPSQQGASLLLAELTCRGAGQYDSRQLSDALESLGVRQSVSVSQLHYVYQGTLMAEQLNFLLDLLAVMVLQPHLAAEEIDNIRSILFQDIDVLHDNPARRVMVELDSMYYPEPYNRPYVGTKEGMNSVTRDMLAEQWQRIYRADGSVLSIAGNIKAVDVIKEVKRCFSSWQGVASQPQPLGDFPEKRYQHIQSDSAQLQIALAYPSAKVGDQDYYVAKVANGVLSGGMFGRLFTEVREKRGLCYAVYSRHVANALYGTSQAYAGTTADRAQDTLDTLLTVLSSLAGTVEAQEIARSKTNLKSSLIIGEESAASRAASNASDWVNLKRVRSLEEVLDCIAAVSAEEIDRYMKCYAPKDFSLVTLGNRCLQVG